MHWACLIGECNPLHSSHATSHCNPPMPGLCSTLASGICHFGFCVNCALRARTTCHPYVQPAHKLARCIATLKLRRMRKRTRVSVTAWLLQFPQHFVPPQDDQDCLAIISATVCFGMLGLTSLAQWYGAICLLICLMSVRKSNLAFTMQHYGQCILNAHSGEIVALGDSVIWSYLLTFHRLHPLYISVALTMICTFLFQHMDHGIIIHPQLQKNSGMPQLPATLAELSEANYRRSRCHRTGKRHAHRRHQKRQRNRKRRAGHLPQPAAVRSKAKPYNLTGGGRRSGVNSTGNAWQRRSTTWLNDEHIFYANVAAQTENVWDHNSRLGAEEILGLQKNENHRQDKSPQCFAILWQLSKRDAVWKWHRTCD